MFPEGVYEGNRSRDKWSDWARDALCSLKPHFYFLSLRCLRLLLPGMVDNREPSYVCQYLSAVT